MMIDSIILSGALICAFYAHALTTPLLLERSFAFILLVVLLSIATFYVCGIYRRIWSQTSGHEVVVIVKAFGISTLISGIIDIMLGHSRPLPISVLLVGNALALMGVVMVRYRSRLVSGLTWRWKAIWAQEFPEDPTRVLIVGAGESGQTFAWRLQHRWDKEHKRAYKIAGFVDDDILKHGLYIEGLPILGGRSRIPELVEKLRIDLIVLAIHNISGADFRAILNCCERTSARIKVVPDTYALVSSTKGCPPIRDLQPEDILGRRPIAPHKAVDLSLVSHKTILVTGAAGSIGSEISRQILAYNPRRLVLVDNNESGLCTLALELRPPPQTEIIPVLADITHIESLLPAFEKHHPEIVFHAAAYKHVPILENYPAEAVRVNVLGTWQVASLAKAHKAERFVFISTDKVVEPTCVMGASKRICELLIHEFARQPEHHTLFTAVRFGNVIGSRGSVVEIFNRQIDAGGPVTVTHPDMTRYFMTIPEAVNLVIHAACLTQGDDLFMLNMGEDIPIVALAERMIRMRGLRPHEDIEIKFTGIRKGEKLHEKLSYDTEDILPTAHPDIMQLACWNNESDPAILAKHLGTLSQLLAATAGSSNGSKPHAMQLSPQTLAPIQADLFVGQEA